MSPDARRFPEGAAFNGIVRRTVADSVPAWAELVRAPAGAANVVVVLLDDTGFADLGCFGGEIRTPTFDRLAAGGLRFRDFHTTALCSPSRASLLTGRNHHVNGFGFLPGSDLGFPGYQAVVPRENGFLSEILRENGYATFAVGKWHLAPYGQMAAGSSKASWPLGRGFDRYYGIMGNCSQWVPSLVHDNHFVAPPRTPDDGYHLNEDMADRAIEFVADLRAVEPDQPFFLYYCPSATHVPHHVPSEWADRYAGRFDKGWDRLRTEVFERQLQLGVVPPGTTLSARPDWIAAWDSLEAWEQKVLAREMEVYAGFLEHTDHHIGRIVSFLESIGELDNTIIIITSDNGADGNHGPLGAKVQGQDIAPGIELDDWGGPGTAPAYSHGWAWVGCTPFRRWKRFVHEGGVTDPLVVHWPRGIRAEGEVRSQYAHITDLAPTILDVLGIDPPQQIGGVAQSPIQGVSFAHTFNDAEAATRKHVQYYEMAGSRAIWADGWKAVTEQRAHVVLTEEELAAQRWELFHVAEDFSESHDLADRHPDKLRQLIELWWTEAGRNSVLPLRAYDPASLLKAVRSIRGEGPRTRFVYHPAASPVPTNLAAPVAGRAHRITVDVEMPEDGGDGVLIAHGGPLGGGYSFYVKDRRLHYTHTHPAVDAQPLTSHTELSAGQHTVAVEVVPTGDQRGVATMQVDGQDVGRATIARTIDGRHGRRDGGGLCCGFDKDPATDAYPAPFRFTGTIFRAVVELRDVGSAQDDS